MQYITSLCKSGQVVQVCISTYLQVNTSKSSQIEKIHQAAVVAGIMMIVIGLQFEWGANLSIDDYWCFSMGFLRNTFNLMNIVMICFHTIVILLSTVQC